MRSNNIEETMLKTTTGADDLRARRGSDQEAIKERERITQRGSHSELLRCWMEDGWMDQSVAILNS